MLHNRVDPWGKLHVVSNRGTLMGNRGILHDADKRVRRQWAHQHWVTCLLKFRDVQRPKPWSTPDNYSELFFLDEATAFSAGHRPCNHCQRDRSASFKAAWIKANAPGAASIMLPDIDKALHRERVDRSRQKLTFEQTWNTLPIGTMFERDGTAYVVSERGALPWSFAGYGSPFSLVPGAVVKVLTTASVVRAFAAGYVPDLHDSARTV